jgi:uncharacterized membrane protein YphA (DoxX/SURF4 family)
MPTSTAIARPSVELANEATKTEAPYPARPWSPLQRIGFRWLFVYVVLYMLQPSPLDFVAPGLVAPYSGLWESIVKGVGRRLLGLNITVLPNTSGDTTYNYVQVLCYALLATLVAAVWTLLDRRRTDYRRLHDWLRAAVRVYLAIFMFLYGSAKVIKTQFPDLSPIPLHLPLGAMSPNTLLWTFMGASTLYTFWAGLLEMVGGLLLIGRRTTLLGALVCIGVMSNVVMLNMSYDVVVKLFSLHLLALAVFLAAADGKRLFDFFIRNRAVPATEIRPLLRAPRRHRAVLVFRTVALLALAAMFVAQAGGRRELRRQGSSSRLQGAWVVEGLRVDGAIPPEADEAAWRRLVVDGRGAAVQLADGRWRRFGWEVVAGNVELGVDDEATPAASFRSARRGPSRLDLTGSIGGRPMTAVLRREEPHFPLVEIGFSWIREGPVR